MDDASQEVFRSIESYRRLEELIEDGETEGLYLECKAPSQPRITKDLRQHLGKAVSGFSNTAGGVIMWGMSTTNHQHSSLDVLTQIEPIGNARHFEQEVKRAIPTVATPAVLAFKTKVIRRSSSDCRGVVLAHIPRTGGDPVQSNEDSLFYFRSGDAFAVAPFEMIKRLFSATDAPQLQPVFNTSLVTQLEDGTFKLPIILTNLTSAIAEHVTISVTLTNADACESIASSRFYDSSSVNPGKKTYTYSASDVIHRGLNLVVGDFLIRMKAGTRPKRRLDMLINLYANRMRATSFKYAVYLAKKGVSVKKLDEKYLY